MNLGDIVHLNWTPQAGNEMAEKHYGVILSSNGFNTLIPRLMVAPITSKKYPAFGPLRVRIETEHHTVRGFICVDKLRSLDPDARNLKVMDDQITHACKNQCKFVLKKIFSI